MSITTVLESAEDQCRMPVTCGITPASSAVAGAASLSSTVAEVSVTAFVTVGDEIDAGSAILAGAASGVATGAVARALAFTAAVRCPRVHHTPAPSATAHNTTAATTVRPGREWSGISFSMAASLMGADSIGAMTGPLLDSQAFCETTSEFSKERSSDFSKADGSSTLGVNFTA